MQLKCNLVVDSPPTTHRAVRHHFQRDLILGDIDHFGIVVGDESAEFFDGQVSWHRCQDLNFAGRSVGVAEPNHPNRPRR